MSERADRHAALMDATYRYQRHFYDLTRKYFLLGRDRLIAGLQIPDGAAVLEVACGTGRNLAAINRRYPGARLFGLDISDAMLASARANLGDRARLARADACDFDPGMLFGQPAFERIVLSYSLSMIPDWRGALGEAMRHLTPGGSLHVVDFGTSARLPSVFRRGLTTWLARFHVAAREDLPDAVAEIARDHGAAAEITRLYRDYAVLAVLRMPRA